ncbi:MAG TPA: type II toxin-antitoxin system VapC family toxin [Gaiellaceae bacterium]
MIVLDTSVLVYAVGQAHALREPSRRVIQAVADGALRATTTVEAIQEFAHVRSQRRSRADAATLARQYADLLGPLVSTIAADVDKALQLFQRHHELGAFDALLAAAALRVEADALISGDAAFGKISALRFVGLGSPQLEKLFD